MEHINFKLCSGSIFLIKKSIFLEPCIPIIMFNELWSSFENLQNSMKLVWEGPKVNFNTCHRVVFSCWNLKFTGLLDDEVLLETLRRGKFDLVILEMFHFCPAGIFEIVGRRFFPKFTDFCQKIIFPRRNSKFWLVEITHSKLLFQASQKWWSRLLSAWPTRTTSCSAWTFHSAMFQVGLFYRFSQISFLKPNSIEVFLRDFLYVSSETLIF